MVNMLEKRKERRIRVSVPIKIVYHDKIEISGKTENISRLGAYVEIEEVIPAGAELDITLNIPKYTKDVSSSGEVRCKGSIFRLNVIRETDSRKVYGIGIFFTDFLQESDRERLSKYIDFLIVQEERDIKKGLKRWREKRDSAQKIREEHQLKQKKNTSELTIDLLKRVLDRLDEIHRLLEAQQKTRP